MTGCATFKSEPIDPEVSAGDWSERTLSDVGLQSFATETGGVSEENWPPQRWDLDALTLAGLYFQPDLELAQAAFDVVDSGREVAAQRPNPTLWLGPGYNSSSSIPTPWILSGNVLVPIETAGKRKFRIAQSQHLSDAARFRMASAAWKIRGDVRRTFLSLWVALGVEKAREIQYRANEKIVQLHESRLQAGEGTLTEVARAQADLNTAEIAWLDSKNLTVIARVNLAGAIGVPVEVVKGVEFDFKDFIAEPIEPPGEEVYHSALLNRADILASLAEYAASESALQLEIARQYPNIVFNPGYSYDQGENKWRLGLNFELPLLNQNQGPIATAEARRRQQASMFKALQTSVHIEISSAVAVYETALNLYESAAEALKAAETREQLARATYQAGQDSRLAVESAVVLHAIAKVNSLDASFKAQDALRSLELAVQAPLDGSDAIQNLLQFSQSP